MPTFLETRNTVRQAIGRASGKMLQGRTYAVTSGTPALIRSEDLLLRTDEFGRGLQIYVPTGGGAGQTRTVVSTAAFVQGTGTLLYPHVDFNPAPSTNAAIELWRGVEALTVNGFIDDAIRHIDPALRVFLFDEVHGRCRRKMALECVDSLRHERDAVDEKENSLHPVSTHEDVRERDYRTRLAGASSHDQQRASVVVLFKGLAYSPDRPCLVVTLADVRSDFGFGERLPIVPPLDEELQLCSLEKSLHRAWWIEGIIPQPVLITVRVEDDGATSELLP